MKKFAFLAALCAFSSPLLAGGVPEINCQDGQGFTAKLEIESGTGIGTLTYGTEGQLQSIQGLDTSFNGEWGAASKSGKALLVITPSGGELVGQLIVEGKTHYMLCETAPY